MDSALQLGQSTIQMCFTVAANTVFNSMSERIYSAEREVQYYVLYFYPKCLSVLLSVSVLYGRNKECGRQIY